MSSSTGAANTNGRVLEYYARPAAITALGRHAERVEGLPDDVGELARVMQGVFIYDAVASEFYGCDLSPERQGAIHLRPVEELLDAIFALDGRPLSTPRPPEKRLAARCHHFARLLVAVVRAKGVPARVRGGFGAYFGPDSFEDHVLCEVWDASGRRWVLVDPQFDEVFRERLGIEHDHLDVPRDQFIVAADLRARRTTRSTTCARATRPTIGCVRRRRCLTPSWTVRSRRTCRRRIRSSQVGRRALEVADPAVERRLLDRLRDGLVHLAVEHARDEL